MGWLLQFENINMKTQGILLVVGAIALLGCDSGDTKVQTYEAAPNQVTNPNAQPGSASTMKESIQGNPNMPQAARDAVLRGGGK